jgi:hypothetical protein
MEYDWLNPRCPIRKLTRDEIVGTAEEIKAKKDYEK